VDPLCIDVVIHRYERATAKTLVLVEVRVDLRSARNPGHCFKDGECERR
jgi:hypothetical protein